MTLLIVGVALFIGAHLIPSVPSLRSRLQKRVGTNAYRGLFALVYVGLLHSHGLLFGVPVALGA